MERTTRYPTSKYKPASAIKMDGPAVAKNEQEIARLKARLDKGEFTSESERVELTNQYIEQLKMKLNNSETPADQRAETTTHLNAAVSSLPK